MKTKRLLETKKMRILRYISEKTLLDKKVIKKVRICRVGDINKWIHERKTEWNTDVNKMEDNRLMKIARNKFAIDRTSIAQLKDDAIK